MWNRTQIISPVQVYVMGLPAPVLAPHQKMEYGHKRWCLATEEVVQCVLSQVQAVESPQSIYEVGLLLLRKAKLAGL